MTVPNRTLDYRSHSRHERTAHADAHHHNSTQTADYARGSGPSWTLARVCFYLERWQSTNPAAANSQYPQSPIVLHLYRFDMDRQIKNAATMSPTKITEHEQKPKIISSYYEKPQARKKVLAIVIVILVDRLESSPSPFTLYLPIKGNHLSFFPFNFFRILFSVQHRDGLPN